MAFPEYRLRNYLQVSWIHENDEHSKWIFGSRKRVSSIVSLEEEIYELRCEMERLVKEGNSLTSAVVVEISTLLDEKLNEYMVRQNRSRS